MAWVAIVAAVAALQYLRFGIQVGRARGRHDVKAPATTGPAPFERQYRIHMNTLELLVMLYPGLWGFATFVDPRIAAGLGVVYLIGRELYARSYLKDPASRAAGFSLSILPILVMLLGTIVGAVLTVI